MSTIQPGIILGDRYRIVRQLGQGGFGRTYLAQDINRFSEDCVLKEFAPQVQGTYALQKGEELFEREAGVLYKLQHPQIPRFRELFRVNLDGKGLLFLVQDYVEGDNLRTLLELRKRQGLQFTEAEVRQLLRQLLPVLEYIHALGVIHRDISPDNLILRNADRLPILIDFGGVKQVVATIVSEFNQVNPGSTTPPGTLLGKVGYAPPEQMISGVVYPQSDLYALAVTVLVLLTAKEPQELIDEQTLAWNWRRFVQLSPDLAAVLDKMLQPKISDRFLNATQVLQALTDKYTAVSAAQIPETIITAPVASALVTQPPPTISSYPKKTSSLGRIFLLLIVLIAATGLGWLGGKWIQSRSNNVPIADDVTPVPTPTTTPQPTPTPQFSAAEQRRKQQLRNTRQQLGIDNNFYNQVVNQAFWEKYPNLRGRSLSSSPEDAALRTQWDETAAEVLEKLDSISLPARQRLGSYSAKDRDRWKQEVNKVYVSSRALYDLTDAAFFQLFPQYQGKNFLNQPFGQIWHAIASDKLQTIVSGATFEKISFAPGTTGTQVSGSLPAGTGKVYIAQLAQDQLLQVGLQAEPQVLLSIYSPSGKILLEDARDRAWSGTLPEAGYYEFVVVSTASAPVNYQLSLKVEQAPPPVQPSAVEPSPPEDANSF